MPPAVLYLLSGTGVVLLAYGLHWMRLTGLRGTHRRLQGELDERRRQLEAANSRIEELAVEDPLTGLVNRRCFDQTLEREWARAARERAQVAVVLMDIDEFGQLNESQGRESGDDRLRDVAALLRQAIHRPGDVAARFAGGQFALLLPGTTQAGAGLLAERVRRTVDGLALAHPDARHQHLTLTCGVAALWPQAGGAASSLLERAAHALRQARQEGGNRIAEAPPGPTPEWSEPHSAPRRRLSTPTPAED